MNVKDTHTSCSILYTLLKPINNSLKTKVTLTMRCARLVNSSNVQSNIILQTL